MVSNISLKTAFLAALIWLNIDPSVAQSQFLPNVDYDSVLHVAKQQNKPMFLVVHQGSGEFFSPFKDTISKEVQSVINEQFISGIVQIDPYNIQHPLLKTFDFHSPIYLFADRDGFPLLRYNRRISHADTLVHLVDSVQRIAQGETMGKLQQQYEKGMRSRALLMKLLKQYQKFDQYTNQQVLYDYLSQLTVEELNNFETVVFLMSCGPIYNSKAYHLARTNDKMTDSLYKTQPLPIRGEINKRIARHTFREALDKRNSSVVYDLGYFMNRSWQPHFLRAKTAQDFYPMEYSRLVRDTTTYISLARNYYNSNFYRIDPDSLAKIDFAHDRSAPIIRHGKILDSTQNTQFQQWMEKNRKRYRDNHARSLSYGARQLLDFESNNNHEVLFDAIRWQQKAISLSPEHGLYHHTLARLLYRVGFFAEAEAEQQQAIFQYKSDEQQHRRMQEVLQHMQDRSWR